jgi:hypothetical protein
MGVCGIVTNQKYDDDSIVVPPFTEATKEYEKAKTKVWKQRRAICRACPSMQYTFLIGRTCGKFLHSSNESGKETCGCILTLKDKLKSAECPQHKWPQ